MFKAISSIIGTLLMLIITIALVGFSYSYISGVFTTKTAEVFYVVDSLNDTVTISNSGTAVVNSMRATLDGNSIPIAVVPNIQGLVGYWSFNEGSGSTASDNSGNRNIGSLINGPMWIDGKYGKAIQFDGVDDGIKQNDGSNVNIVGDITVEAWVKPTLGSDSTVVHKDGQYSLLVRGGTGFVTWADSSIWSYATFGNQNIGLQANTWQHLVATDTGGTVRLYLDGQDKFNKPFGGFLTATNAIMHIGCYSGTDVCSTNFFNGAIDEVRIYNRALSESEIKQLYSGLILPGQLATIKPLATLTSGKHTLRLCTSSMCSTAVLTIR
ncbi:MAG: hypothetical protein HY361_01935 [Candidatus Aenigmarchaeota archaeon]|nr:hypothetical protein [Candidatus Aenigmarchaeota archaeon]